MFSIVTKKSKVEGRGEIESLPSIEPEDLKTLSTYFENNVMGPPYATLLQEIAPFNILYYMERQGRENLR